MTPNQLHAEDLIDTLFQCLVNDGFTAYYCGPEDSPHALIAYYEWDDHVDLVTVPRTGPAASARLTKPISVLAPSDTALWTCVGEPEAAVCALLELAHPEDAEAPAGVFPTPATLRVPSELQRPIAIRVPAEGRAGSRADRLKLAREYKCISQEFFRELFDQVDSAAAIAAAENFTGEGQLQFANYPPMVGRAEIARFVVILFRMTAGVRHEIYNFWELADRTAFTNGVVTFTRHDRTELVVPFATVSQFNESCTELIRHQVYVDASGLAPAPVL